MNGIKKLDITDSEYPEILKLIKDPPTSLYYSGNIELLSNRCISIVGARKATEYGLETAWQTALIRQLTEAQLIQQGEQLLCWAAALIWKQEKEEKELLTE